MPAMPVSPSAMSDLSSSMDDETLATECLEHEIETVDLPKKVAIAGNRPYVPQQEAPRELVLCEELFDKSMAQLRRALFEKGYGTEALPSFSIVAGLVLMKHGVDPNCPATAREENAALLPSAAGAAITAQENTVDGSMMKLNTKEARQDLRRINSLQQLHLIFGWMPGAIRNNLAVTEQHLGNLVRTGVKRITSLVDTDNQLKMALEGALYWIQLPSKRAQETRKDHERILAEQGKKDNKPQSKDPATGTEPTKGEPTPSAPSDNKPTKR